MARGQAQAAGAQLGTTNAIGAQQGAQASQLENQLIPSYTSMMSTGYMNPQQSQAATEQGMGAVNTSFDESGNQLQRESARTNNPASLTAGEDAQALSRGTALGSEANSLAEQQFNNQLKGASGLQSLYNTNQGTANSMYGLGPGTLQARAAGQPSPILGIAQSALGAAGAAACWIARAIYGEFDWRPDLIAEIWWRHWAGRSYMARVLLAAYLVVGEPLGWIINKSTLLQKILRPIADKVLAKAIIENA